MTAYLLGRLVAAVPVLFGISLLVFVLVRLTPGDPALAIGGPTATRDELDLIRQSLGLDQPIPVQYVLWLGRAAHADLGRSILTGSAVTELVLQRAANSAILAGFSLGLALLIALPAGIVSAVYRNTGLDSGLTVFTLLGQSMAPFWTGLVLILLFSVQLRWLPTSGMQSVVGGGGLFDLARHLVLPTLTMGLFQVAMLARMTRSSMLEVLSSDHLTTAKAKGLSGPAVIWGHAVRLALLPVVTVLGVRLGYLVGGAVVVETVFSWPGLGYQMYSSIAARDYAFIQAAVLFSGCAFVFTNLAIDVAYVFIDPRIRYQR